MEKSQHVASKHKTCQKHQSQSVTSDNILQWQVTISYSDKWQYLTVTKWNSTPWVSQISTGLLYDPSVAQPTPVTINQTSIAPISPAKPGSMVWQPNQVFDSKIKETFPLHQQARGSDGNYGGKAKSKRCVFRYFLKVATEMAERTDTRRLFQSDGAQEWKALAPVLVLTLGTNKLLSLFDLSE